MRDQFLLTFEEGLPKGTNQQKRYNHRTRTYYKDSKLSALEATFICALKPHRPKGPSEAAIRLDIWLTFSITSPKRLWGTWKATRPDVDNYAKTFIDCMTRTGFFKDDAQVVDLRVRKTYAEKASIFVQWAELGDRP